MSDDREDVIRLTAQLKADKEGKELEETQRRDRRKLQEYEVLSNISVELERINTGIPQMQRRSAIKLAAVDSEQGYTDAHSWYKFSYRLDSQPMSVLYISDDSHFVISDYSKSSYPDKASVRDKSSLISYYKSALARWIVHRMPEIDAKAQAAAQKAQREQQEKRDQDAKDAWSTFGVLLMIPIVLLISNPVGWFIIGAIVIGLATCHHA